MHLTHFGSNESSFSGLPGCETIEVLKINYAVSIYLVYRVFNLYYNSNFCFYSKIKEHFMITLVEMHQVIM